MLAASGETDAARRAIAAVRELAVAEVRLAARGERRPGCLDRDRRRRSRNGRILRRAMETLERGEHTLWWRAATLGLADVLVELGGHTERASSSTT